MIRVRWIVLAIATLLVVSACQFSKESFSCYLSPTNSSSQSPSSQSQTLKVAMYVDGTPSMQGYVTHPTGTTRYTKTIDLLDGILPPPSQNEYYRLGETSTGETSEKIDRDKYREAQKRQFYDGTDPTNFPPLKVSKIETAITPAEDGKLTVIITDLYQAKGDVNKLKQEIEKKYLNTNQQGFAVGIIGIKSEFNGDVYREDGTEQKFRYETNNKQDNPILGKELRPFYVIFIGRYSDIDPYFKKLSQELPKDSRQLVIFSPNNLVKELAYLQGKPQLPKSGIRRIPSLSKNQIRVERRDEKNELFQIDNKATQDLTIQYTVPLQQLDNTLSIQADSIQPVITKIKASDRLERKLKEEKLQDSSLRNALKLSEWNTDDNKNLKFVTTIKPSDIPEPGIYLFTVDAVAQGVQEQKWWSEWSSNNNTSNDWKTYNLEAFLKGLKDSIDSLIAKNQVVIGRFCYGIQKN